MQWTCLMLTIAAAAAGDPKGGQFDYIIQCHSTDFECLRRQYSLLRDHVYLGNERLGVPPYAPHVLGGAAVSGLEDSELSGIRFGKNTLSLFLEFPIKVTEDKRRRYLNSRKHKASVIARFPYRLHEKRNYTYLMLKQEALHVTLQDSKEDYSDFKNNSLLSSLDLTSVVAPYTGRMRTFASRVPLERILLLYPDETYRTLNFSFSDGRAKCLEYLGRF